MINWHEPPGGPKLIRMSTQPPPAQDDGERSLRSAAKSLIVAATTRLLVTIVLGDVLLSSHLPITLVGLVCLGWALPAAGLLACGIGLQQHQPWACAVGRVLAAVYVLAAIAGEVVSGLYGVVQEPVGALAGATFFALIAYVFASLPGRLTRARQHIDSRCRGFEPILKAPPASGLTPRHDDR